MTTVDPFAPEDQVASHSLAPRKNPNEEEARTFLREALSPQILPQGRGLVVSGPATALPRPTRRSISLRRTPHAARHPRSRSNTWPD